EDGIRDGHVTGVQTCALPISGLRIGYEPDDEEQMTNDETKPNHEIPKNERQINGHRLLLRSIPYSDLVIPSSFDIRHSVLGELKIGRASCRERVKISVVGEFV